MLRTHLFSNASLVVLHKTLHSLRPEQPSPKVRELREIYVSNVKDDVREKKSDILFRVDKNRNRSSCS